MQYTMKNFYLLSALLCLFTFSFPLQSNAEEKVLEQNTLQMPSLGGKLNLTPQKQEENSAQQDEQKENLQNKETEEPEENQEKEQVKTGLSKEKKIQTKHEDIVLAPGHNQNSVIMQEDGSNVIIVHGSNKAPENYTNSTNVNNGFYMNITNPDGSGMNMGTYFNSNSNSNSLRKRSSAQIIVDKME